MLENLSFETKIGGNTVYEYFFALAVFFGVIFVISFLKNQIISRVRSFERFNKDEKDGDGVLVQALKILNWKFSFVIAFYVMSRFLNLPQNVLSIVSKISFVIVVFFVIKFLQILLSRYLDIFLQKISGDKLDKTILNFFHSLLSAILWIIGLIVVLQNLGVQITALLGGLGIAGLAIAFAIQNILEDIFAFFTIYFDKPFKKGDFINVGTDAGTIEKIGMRTTKIRSTQGQKLIISNKELTSSRIQNFQRMPQRRVAFEFGVLYETPLEKIKEIPNIIQECIENEKMTTFDRANFRKFGDSALIFDAVYFIDSEDFKVYCDIQQKINIKLMEVFKKENIEFAYPTQTLYLKK